MDATKKIGKKLFALFVAGITGRIFIYYNCIVYPDEVCMAQTIMFK
jgi:hypothetical protein